jgi:hypothetical protein
MSVSEILVEGVLPLLGMLLSFAMVIGIVLIVTRSKQRRMEMQYDLQSKLIEKFGSTGELVSFLQSETGQRFVNSVQTGGTKLARDRAAAAVRIGIIFTALGIGFLVLWAIMNVRGLAWPGVLFAVLGAAYFASSYATLRFSQGRPAEPPPSLPTSTNEG